jgi:hypothetical protein
VKTGTRVASAIPGEILSRNLGKTGMTGVQPAELLPVCLVGLVAKGDVRVVLVEDLTSRKELP